MKKPSGVCQLFKLKFAFNSITVRSWVKPAFFTPKRVEQSVKIKSSFIPLQSPQTGCAGAV
jgi:hypothetical protein